GGTSSTSVCNTPRARAAGEPTARVRVRGFLVALAGTPQGWLGLGHAALCIWAVWYEPPTVVSRKFLRVLGLSHPTVRYRWRIPQGEDPYCNSSLPSTVLYKQ